MQMRLLRTSRRAAASLALALPLLLLSACGDDEPRQERTAYQADSGSSESATAAAADEPSGAATDETAEPSEAPQSQEAPSPSATQPAEEATPSETQQPAEEAEPASDQECVGADYTFTDLDHLTCEEAKIMVENILNTGGNRDNGTVADDQNRCQPEGSGWWCQPDADGAEWPSTTITPNDPSYDPMDQITRTWMPGGSRDAAAEQADAAPSDTAAVECTGQRFLLTDVSGLSCPEAMGMMDPFLSTGQQGGRISDVQCTVDSGEFQGETRERWSCSRDSGGSLVAYRK